MMERELRAPHVILFRVSFRSWLRQPLCQSSATALRRKASPSASTHLSSSNSMVSPTRRHKAENSVQVDSAPPLVEWRHFSVVYSSGPCERMLPSSVWAQLVDVT